MTIAEEQIDRLILLAQKSINDIAALTTRLAAVEAWETVNLVDRGDPAAFDFSVNDLSTDGDWHDLDLSSIVPEGTVAVKVAVGIEDDAAGSAFSLRKNGNSNTINRFRIITQDAGDIMVGSDIVFCDENRVIEYLATSTTWTTINIAVTGWIIQN